MLRFFFSTSVIASLLVFSSYTFHGDEGKPELLVELMLTGMNRLHYQPQELNDQFSEQVFDQYIKSLDYYKRFFTARDIENLSHYRHLIDDQLKIKSFELFDVSVKLFDQRMEEAQRYYREILSRPFDFERDEAMEADPDKIAFVNSTSELKERWRKSLKYQVLTRLTTMRDRQEKKMAQEDGNPEATETKTLAEMEAEVREKVLKNHDDWFHRMERRKLDDRRTDFLNSITHIYDPYTEYFPPKDREDFDIRISGRLEGIGAQLQEEEGYIKVVTIVPGSACARQGQLEVNDVVLKVAQGSDEPVDVIDMDVNDAVQLIRGKKGTEVRLTVRKIDGAIVVIPIIRDIVEIEETYAKSAILKTEGQKRGVGYIHLPKFYFDFNSRDSRRCATDVAKEIEKLKAERVEGIILDLRDNGGGSLQDVVEMAGLFIESGPIVQIKSRHDDPDVLSDRDPQVQYSGPLVVMINSLSASASEIMAAAIQDYGRGIIVGAPSYGKGTVQVFVDLDRLKPRSSKTSSLGDVKITTQKFYRINGGATQHKGVIPDIQLPDEYSLLGIGEKEQEFSMPWDEIEPVRYQEWNLGTDLAKLQANSQTRVANNPTFDLIKENAARLKRRQDRHTYPLKLSAFEAEQEQLDQEAKKYKEIRKPIPGLEIQILKGDQVAIQADSVKSKRISDWHERIRKDVHLYESLQIIRDM